MFNRVGKRALWRLAICLAASSTAYVAHAQADQLQDRQACGGREPQLSSNDQITACTRLIDSGRETQPYQAVAFYNRGFDYFDRDQYDLAIEDYTRAISLEPHFAKAFGGRGLAYGAKGQYDRAIEDFNRMITLTDDPVAFMGRGGAYLGNHQYDRAMEDFNGALALKPDLEPAYAGRSNAEFKLERYDEAVADARYALRLDPSDSWARSTLNEAEDAKTALLARASAPATGARVALVIGNSNYLNTGSLANPAHDAEDVAKELSRLGYKIYGFKKTDFTKDELNDAIAEFKRVAVGASAAIVWYSGHGEQMLEEGSQIPRDFIIPVDAKINSRRDISAAAIPLDDLKTAVLAAKTLRVVVIDACRDNRFYTGFRGPRGLTVNATIKGVLVVFSTKPGNLAEDGENGARNSPFAQAFLDVVRSKPRLELRQFFGAVGGEVVALTRGEQSPESVDGLNSGEALSLAP